MTLIFVDAPWYRRNALRIRALLFAATIFGCGYYVGSIGPEPVQENPDFERLNQALLLIQKTGLEPPSKQALLDGAIGGMMHTLDAHSDYLPKSELTEFTERSQGRYVGIGVEVTRGPFGPVVIAPFDGSPAKKAGLLPKDIIGMVNGKPTQGRALMDVVNELKGKAGTSIEVTLIRDNAALPPLTLTRAPVFVSAAVIKHFGDYAYLRISHFQSGVAQQALALLSASKVPKGMVLDLRSNPGGLLLEGVGVASLFLPEKALVTSAVEQDGKRTEYKADLNAGAPKWLSDTPIIVLVDNGTASAAELLAGALRDHKRATLFGSATYGKGSFQRVLPLTGGGALKLTQGLYYLPSGTSPHKTGLIPDRVVDSANELEGAGSPLGSRASLVEEDTRDPVLAGALAALAASNVHPTKSAH